MEKFDYYKIMQEHDGFAVDGLGRRVELIYAGARLKNGYDIVGIVIEDDGSRALCIYTKEGGFWTGYREIDNRNLHTPVKNKLLPFDYETCMMDYQGIATTESGRKMKLIYKEEGRKIKLPIVAIELQKTEEGSLTNQIYHYSLYGYLSIINGNYNEMGLFLSTEDYNPQ